MSEGGGASPVFVGCVREENFGDDVVGCCAIEQAGLFFGDGIGFGLVGEREDISGIEDGRSRLRVAGGLCEAIVKAAAAGSGDMGEDAVEGDASVFVGVEALVEEVAEEATVLGDAFGDDAGWLG